MKRIEVKNLIGQRCLTQEQGQKLFEAAQSALRDGEEICFDFAGVIVILSLFLNHGVGQLLKEIRPEEFDRLVKVENLNPSGRMTYERVIENAKQYYWDQDARKAIDEVLLKQAMEEAGE